MINTRLWLTLRAKGEDKVADQEGCSDIKGSCRALKILGPFHSVVAPDARPLFSLLNPPQILAQRGNLLMGRPATELFCFTTEGVCVMARRFGDFHL